MLSARKVIRLITGVISSQLIELVSHNLTLFYPKNIQFSKLNQSTRVVKIDFTTLFVHLKELLVQNLTEKSFKVWKFSDKIRAKSFETSSILQLCGIFGCRTLSTCKILEIE